MTEITLYQQDRFLIAQMLPLWQREHLRRCLNDCLKSQVASSQLEKAVDDAMNSKPCDLEDLLTIHYVDGNRNLSKVSPIPTHDYLILYSRQDFAPLLKALKEGDFELANVLSPPKFRLIGYQELKETKEVEEQGQGWGRQHSLTLVPPGIYPVFTRSFAFHRERGLYQNHLRDSDGITTWLEGKCVRSSDTSAESHPFDKVCLGNPYAHTVAEDIWKEEGSISLIQPFEAVKVTNITDEKMQERFQIMDISLPALLSVNPVLLRTEEERFDNAWEKASLNDQIGSAAKKKKSLSMVLTPNRG